ncbi:hypothetical protein [Costertonia aggregata]|uniref:SGNH/GDSL hydrolase family protein n=1 Tax=Costertonia aggregata TaxID=343403 RepID=A0A7H9AP75_9FLAO|nr:hypothetical protein [Costertonia aggregata]QLG45242.1 hypothetical protein HYG79_07745 [Costertonia aggregata]
MIAHIGVVDFSPRPKSTIGEILKLKKKKIISCFGEGFYKEIIQLEMHPTMYMKEHTAAILSKKAIPKIASHFNTIPGLIWITCNPVDLNWRGNYGRDRPANINIVNEKSILLKKALGPEVKCIDLTKLSLEEVHEYTCDNIHLSAKGMKLIEKELKNLVLNT